MCGADMLGAGWSPALQETFTRFHLVAISLFFCINLKDFPEIPRVAEVGSLVPNEDGAGQTFAPKETFARSQMVATSLG